MGRASSALNGYLNFPGIGQVFAVRRETIEVKTGKSRVVDLQRYRRKQMDARLKSRIRPGKTKRIYRAPCSLVFVTKLLARLKLARPGCGSERR